MHDLRRTARSLISRAGVRPDIAERVLGHAIKGVEGVYDRHSYVTEKAHALTALAGLLANILRPEAPKVVKSAGIVFHNPLCCAKYVDSRHRISPYGAPGTARVA